MNGKQAKKLRRAAMGFAVTMSDAGKDISSGGHVEEKHPSTAQSYESILSNTASREEALIKLAGLKSEIKPERVTVHNKENSLRGIYRTLKKGVTSGKVK